MPFKAPLKVSLKAPFKVCSLVTLLGAPHNGGIGLLKGRLKPSTKKSAASPSMTILGGKGDKPSLFRRLFADFRRFLQISGKSNGGFSEGGFCRRQNSGAHAGAIQGDLAV